MKTLVNILRDIWNTGISFTRLILIKVAFELIYLIEKKLHLRITDKCQRFIGIS